MMGLFSSIANIALKPSTFVGNLIGSGLKKTGIVSSYTPQKTETLSKTTFGKVLGTAIGVTAGALVVASAPVTSLKVAKSVGGFIAKNPIKSAIGSLVVVPALASSSKLRSGATAGIKEIPSFGSGIGNVIEGDMSIGDFIKEHPILSTGTVITGGVVGGKALAPVIGGALAGRNRGSTTLVTSAEAPVGASQGSPLLPPTSSISTPSTPKRAYRPRKATKPQNIKQSVRVNVIASPKSTGIKLTNKKYITERLLN